MSWWEKFFRGLEPLYTGPKHKEAIIRSVKHPDGLPEESLISFKEQLRQGFLSAEFSTMLFQGDVSSEEFMEIGRPCIGRLLVDIQIETYEAPGLVGAFASPFKETKLVFGFSLSEPGSDKPFATGKVSKKAEHFGLIGGRHEQSCL